MRWVMRFPRCLPLVVAVVLGLATSGATAEALVAPPRLFISAVDRVGTRVVASGERGFYFWSDDLGVSWQRKQLVPRGTLTRVRFFDDQNGWIVGQKGLVLRTTNGGHDWVQVLDGVRAARIALDSLPDDASTQLRRDAERLVEEGADKPFFDVQSNGALQATVVGAFGIAFRTVDGGKTWSSLLPAIDNPQALHLYGMAALRDGRLLIAGEGGRLFLEAPEVGHFNRLDLDYSGSLFGVASAGDWMYAYGLRGNVFAADQQAGTWRRCETPTVGTISDGRAVDARRMLLSTVEGQVLVGGVTDDGRCHFETVETDAQLPTAAIMALNDSTILRAGPAGATVHSVLLPVPSKESR